MSTLAVVGIGMLGVIVGIAIGVRFTSYRYHRTLSEVHDITEYLMHYGKR